jgi:hypothetical protein
VPVRLRRQLPTPTPDMVLGLEMFPTGGIDETVR